MSSDASPPGVSRRDFLSARVAPKVDSATPGLEPSSAALRTAPSAGAPSAGATVRLGQPHMACDFDFIFNPGQARDLAAASEALDLVGQLESQLSVYRTSSELSQLNARASAGPVPVEASLFELLLQARQLALDTASAFDPTAGAFIALWRQCRQEALIPTDSELADIRQRVGIEHVQFDERNRTIAYDRPGVELNLGAIGKGYALDRAAEVLAAANRHDWLLHAGHSSLLARGRHADLEGWPIGLRNPLFPKHRLATLLLCNCGMSTSGSGVQYFRHDGRRYGHLLDPRTGWPVDHLLSVTVLAPTAAEADALSTAFFVLGVEKSREYCHNREGIAALLIPPPTRGKRLAPVNLGIPEELLFLEAAAAVAVE